MTERFDSIILGAGEAGATFADLALADGHRVAMVYREPYGSTCLNAGCVPSKFLIHRAKVAHLIRTAARFGLEASPPRVNLAAVVAEKNQMLDTHRRESFQAAQQAEGLELVVGTPRLTSEREVMVGDRRLCAERIFIATGMRPLIPQVEGLDRVSYHTSDDVMDITQVPGRLIVLGGGYVACELAQTYARFGSRVAIVQSRLRLLPNEEPDVAMVLAEAFIREGIELLLGYRAVKVEQSTDGIRLTARPTEGRDRVIEGTHLLVAAGRRPNTDELALDAAGVATDDKGFIRVNEYLETTASGIWAAGDVLGKQPFTRVSQEEAKVAYANAMEDTRAAFDRSAYGHAVFTDPEIGSVGLTEATAREQGIDVAAGYVTFDQVAKAELIGETRGFIKYVVDSDRRLVGAHVIGSQAADLVYDAIVLMRHKRSVDELGSAVGIFPTLQEGMEGSARALLGRVADDRAATRLRAGESVHTRPRSR